MKIFDSLAGQLPVQGFLNCSCNVPAWAIVLAVLLALCLAVLLLVVLRNCKEAMIECKKARMQADTDELTGLWNRHAINRVVCAGVSLRKADAQPWSVIFMDINGFKSINDRCGHVVGDAVLKIFAQDLLSAIRASDHAGRWGGDEFIVLVSGMRSHADIKAFCHKLMQATSTTITVDANEVKISVSYGYALANIDGESVMDLIRVADARMYKNKQRCAQAR